MKRKTIILAVLAFLNLSIAYGVTSTPMVDDSDLSGPSTLNKFFFATSKIAPDRVVQGESASGLSLRFVRMVKGKETAIEGLVIKNSKTDANGWVTSPTCVSGSLNVSIPLTSARYEVASESEVYELAFIAQCGVTQKIIFDETSNAGEVMAIWQVAKHAENKLQENVGLDFWRDKIQFVFPADGDYYSFGTVHITLGHQWDVVSHELGHAIYDQASLGVFGNGSHKIDECYGADLGLSEGWASFFSAWLNLDLNDPDAKFEYMVPRRAPIQVENVPADVCGKSESEWRTFSFLWDLIDLHNDGENLSEPFQKLWTSTLNKNVSSIVEMKNLLLSQGWDKQQVELVWKLNFPAAERTY